MASSKKIGSDKGSVSSLEKVKKEAEKLQSTLEDAGSVEASASKKPAGNTSLFAVENTPVPNPSEPMDHSVLENIGIVGAGSSITSSSIASVASLSDAHKNASKGSLLPNQVKPATEKFSSGIQVDPKYKPAFESEEKAKLSASMDRPKSSGIGSNPASSLQSRLGNEKGNVYRSAVEGSSASNQTLGGGFRIASDPNHQQDNRMSPGGSYQAQDYGQAVGQGNNKSAPQQTVYHTETAPEKSGKGLGAIGLIGGLLVAGGVGAVVMNPDLLSTTGISLNKAETQVVSAPEALIPQATPSRPVQVRKVSPVVQERKVAAVQVMPAPVVPAIVTPTVPTVAKTSAVQSNTRFSETGKDVPLNLDPTDLKVKADQYIRIGGMPEGATLSSGVDMGDGNWLVAPDAVKGLKFTALDGYKGTTDLYMQKVKDDARTAVGTPKTFKVAIGDRPAPVVAASPQIVRIEPKVASYNPVPVQPQTAPATFKAAPTPRLPKLPEGISEANEDDGIGVLPTAKANKYQRPRAQGAVVAPARAPRRLSQGIPVGRTFSTENYGDTAEPIQQERIASLGGAVAPIPQISDQRAKLLLKRGNNLYRLGDLISARSLYGQVAAGGNAEAAMAMGRTYDPIYFEKLGVQGFQPEPNRALEWYEKAKGAGLSQAQGKIDNLNYYLKQ